VSNIHIACDGDPLSRPAVILDTDIAETLDVWGWIQQTLGNITKNNNTYVCSFTRRGYGYSLPAPLTQRSAQITAVEMYNAFSAFGLLQANRKVVLVGRGYASYELLTFYNFYSELVAALVFLDGYYASCITAFPCRSTSVKNDTETAAYTYLENALPAGLIRAEAYAGNYSQLSPRGQCVPLLSGTNYSYSERLLAALLTPSQYTNAVQEDIFQPESCNVSLPLSKIKVPLYVLVPEFGHAYASAICKLNMTNLGGGNFVTSPALTKNLLMKGVNQYTMICNQTNAVQVSKFIFDAVYEVKQMNKNYTAYKVSGNWTMSKSYCESLGQKMAAPSRLEASQRLNLLGGTLLYGGSVGFWIDGYRAAGQNTSYFELFDGSQVGFDTVPVDDFGTTTKVQTFTNWQAGSPTVNAANSCRMIPGGFPNLGNLRVLWKNDLCTKAQYVVCESLDY
jgi:pimeloyl-ACP methyl ester carboxylesterase